MTPITILINPVPAPRQSERDKFNPSARVKRYRAFCNELRWLHKKQLIVPENVLCVNLTFIMAMPKSWSFKKKADMSGEPHRQTPDIDNLVKAFLDAICEDDKFVPGINACKEWGEIGKIIFSCEVANVENKYKSMERAARAVA